MQSNEENKPVADEAMPASPEMQIPVISEADEDIAEPIVTEDELASLSKEQLAGKLEELLSAEDVLSGAELIRLIKDTYDKSVKEEYERKLKVFMQDGSPAEDFEPAPDPLDQKVERLYKEFNKKKPIAAG